MQILKIQLHFKIDFILLFVFLFKNKGKIIGNFEYLKNNYLQKHIF